MGSLQKDSHSSQSGMIPGSWQHKMKLQLILKSSKAYYVLSDAALSLQKYGRALRYIKLALQSHGKSRAAERESCPLGNWILKSSLALWGGSISLPQAVCDPGNKDVLMRGLKGGHTREVIYLPCMLPTQV